MRLERWLSTLPLKLRDLFRRQQVEQDLDDEIRFHLEHKIETFVAGGMTPEEARCAALRAFGGVAQRKEDCRETRGSWIVWLESVWRDVRYSWRMLAKNPGFTIVAVLSLAIGIGANTAVFSFTDTMLLRPLNVPRAGEVLTVGSTSPAAFRPVLLTSYRDYVDVRDRNQSFDALAAFTDAVVAIGREADASPRLTIGMLVSGDFFRVAGVNPELGRAFRADEDQVPGRDAVVMLGHDFWQREFGADRSILGRTVRLNGIAFTVVGVTPPGFTGLDQYIRYDFYVPLMMWPRLMSDPKAQPLEARDLRSLSVRGRLKPGVTMTEAQTEL